MNNIAIETIKNDNRFDLYYQVLVRENSKYNLTAIVDKKEVYYKHFLDCALVLNYIDLSNKSVCDVGSGAGFPGIVLKLLCPSIKLIIIEPIAKRCNFLKMLVRELKLEDVNIINGRAEEQIELREKFDYVFARAVSNLPMLIEICVPLVKVDGFFAPLKGSNYNIEVNESTNALHELDSNIENVYEYKLDQYGERSIILIRKNKKTNSKYPRAYSKIKNSTL